jgi:hypothetical protein
MNTPILPTSYLHLAYILPTLWRLFYAAYYASALVRTLVVFAGALTLAAVLLGALFFSGARASASALMGTARVVQVPCGQHLDATVQTDP